MDFLFSQDLWLVVAGAAGRHAMPYGYEWGKALGLRIVAALTRRLGK
jgi:hypothetical protein